MNNYKNYAFIVILIGVLLRFSLALNYPVSSDSCWHLAVSRFIAREFTVPSFEPLGREVFHEPFAFHLLASVFYLTGNVFGYGNEFMKLVSPLFGSLSLIFVWLLAKKLFDEKTAFFSTLFFAFIPQEIFLSTIAHTDSVLIFFSLSSIYAAVSKRVLLSAVLFGLAVFTKFNAFALFPAHLFILFSSFERKTALTKSVAFVIITALVISPFLIKNTVNFGNPFWPYFVELLGGPESLGDAALLDQPLKKLFFIDVIVSSYLGFFGVPNGSTDNLFIFRTVLLPFLLLVWFAATVIFSFPVFFGARQLKTGFNRNLLFFWLVPFLLVPFVYALDTGIINDVGRYMAPTHPAIALFAGFFLSKFGKKAFALFILSIIGFSGIEIIKTGIANSLWSPLEKDFVWVKQNTPENSLFYSNGQCLAFHLDRPTKHLKEDAVLKKSEFVFENSKFTGDILFFNAEILKNRSHKLKTVYENPDTKTKVYEVK